LNRASDSLSPNLIPENRISLTDWASLSAVKNAVNPASLKELLEKLRVVID
jgi:hypothetical protein